MTVRFAWEHATRKEPHGVLVEVVYDQVRRRVVAANYSHNGYPVPHQELPRIQSDVREKVKEVKGWTNFTEGCIHLLP